MKKSHTNPVPPDAQAEIDTLAAAQTPIRTDLTPESTADWSQGKRGVFYRPVKQQITLRLDADLIDWFKTNPVKDEGYQTSINRALREYVTQKLATPNK
jgi:uncharacterized protein (DUF4415 family)